MFILIIVKFCHYIGFHVSAGSSSKPAGYNLQLNVLYPAKSTPACFFKFAPNHSIFMLPKVQQVRPKGPPFGFFSALCDFFRKFSNIIKGYPLHFLKFSVCKKRLMCLNDLFLGFSALCDLTEYFLKYIFFQMLPIVVFGLVRLFRKFFKCLQRVPPSFFPIFQKMDVQKLPNAPFYVCRH